MRKGGGKNKGSKFERKVCSDLSLWITKGKNKDCFWRSAMSGGRATVHHTKGTKIRQAGDICAVSPEGHEITNHWFIECKHVKSLDVLAFLYSNKGKLAKFWKVVNKQADNHELEPMIIAKENNSPILVITRPGRLGEFITVHFQTLVFAANNPLIKSNPRACDISLFTDMIAIKRK